MKFIHIADLHLGAEPDAGRAYSQNRSQELWETLQSVLEVCEEEQTDLLLIAGDIFHGQPLRRELKELNYYFAELTHTKVVLIAGNHDYIRKDSYNPFIRAGTGICGVPGTEDGSVWSELLQQGDQRASV